ncbi:hypothetical protein LSH36_55g00042 [Paralvinella palmiformis]|uniref:Uncharacterized protein n=1 Tax=Paralvinella palmiformis TaxID=53620 RepID=A0AAD9K5R8_9ANNE|nr:hypothetical protein LSH36_55g00042 [Paralvinella palmiformis]
MMSRCFYLFANYPDDDDDDDDDSRGRCLGERGPSEVRRHSTAREPPHHHRTTITISRTTAATTAAITASSPHHHTEDLISTIAKETVLSSTIEMAVTGKALYLGLIVALTTTCRCSADNLNLNGYRINVDGFERIRIARPDGQAVSLAPRGFYERDQHGKDVPGDAHKVQLADMASQNVTVGEACSRLIPNSNTEGRFLNVDAILEGDHQTVSLGYDVYYATRSGAFVRNKELQRIYANNVILTLTLDGWKWCSPCDGDDGASVTGAFLDVDVIVELPEGATVEEQDVKNGPREITLGNRMTLYLSNQVMTDGTWHAMPSGYPKLTAIPDQPNSYAMIIRLPKFDVRVMYDPVISIDDGDVKFPEPDNDTSNIPCSRDNGGDAPMPGTGNRPSAASWWLLWIFSAFSLCGRIR